MEGLARGVLLRCLATDSTLRLLARGAMAV
jgi:hypothetical protein